MLSTKSSSIAIISVPVAATISIHLVLNTASNWPTSPCLVSESQSPQTAPSKCALYYNRGYNCRGIFASLYWLLHQIACKAWKSRIYSHLRNLWKSVEFTSHQFFTCLDRRRHLSSCIYYYNFSNSHFPHIYLLGMYASLEWCSFPYIIPSI